MSKEDVGELPPVPVKRRQLERALDLHIAMWLARDDLTPSQRRRVEEEKLRRKASLLPVRLGFTATREGLTPQQRRRIEELVDEYASRELIEAGVVEGHHGDCVGGDEQIHEILRERGIDVVLHPPKEARLRAFCKGAVRSEKAKDFLERDRDIVHAGATVLIGAPKETREPSARRAGGTWYTIRVARRRGVPTRVIMPTGEEMA